MYKSFSKACIFLVVCIFLSACSPRLNWRLVQSPEQRYSALFPGKPEKIDRQIPFQDQELKQTLEAVKIDDDIYSISSIQLLKNQASLAPKIISQLQENLFQRAKSSGGSVAEENSFYQTADHQRLPTKDYFLTFGPIDKHQQAMRVRWIVRQISDSVWIYQVSVLQLKPSSEDAKMILVKEEFANFFNEFYSE